MMRLVILSLLLLLTIIAAFVALNWPAFLALSPLSLAVATVDGPLGLIMLLIAALLIGPSWAYAFYVRRTGLLRAGRTAQEMQSLRELAERAEASRYTELREFLATELQKIREQNFQLRAEMLADLERFSSRLEAAAPPAQPTELTAEEGIFDLEPKEEPTSPKE